MNDDVKAARESIKEFRDWAQRLNQLARYSEDGMTHSLIAADNQRAIEVKTKALLAHIDGEPARIAAAREEQREACARRVDEVKCYGYGVEADEAGTRDQCAEEVRVTPLTATPLGDRIAELERQLAEWAEKDGNSPGYNLEKAKTYGRIAVDPAHIHAASFAVHGALGWGFDPNTVSPVSLARAAEALSAECVGLRAQVNAARKLLKGHADCRCGNMEPHHILEAMDEAAKR